MVDEKERDEIELRTLNKKLQIIVSELNKNIKTEPKSPLSAVPKKMSFDLTSNTNGLLL
jgi:hypothetical protein